jgi:hypothetical protein
LHAKRKTRTFVSEQTVQLRPAHLVAIATHVNRILVVTFQIRQRHELREAKNKKKGQQKKEKFPLSFVVVRVRVRVGAASCAMRLVRT